MAQITLNSSGVASNGTLALQSNGTTTAVTVDASQNVGIGISSPLSKLHVVGTTRISGVSAGGTALYIPAGDIVGDVSSGVMAIGNVGDSSSETRIMTRGFTTFRTGATSGTNGTEVARITSTGLLGLGTSSPSTRLHAAIGDATAYATNLRGNILTLTNTSNGGYAGIDFQTEASGGGNSGIAGINSYTGSSGNAVLTFSTRGSSALAERARILETGEFLVGRTTDTFSTVGATIRAGGSVSFTVNSNEILDLNRLTTDGTLVRFYQDGTQEGNISVSGTTVSYNGGHLSRYAQTTTAKDESIVKGTVLSNLDAMNVYTDAEGNPVDNEQLNKVKVSDVEGDANVAGVFVNWTHDEDHDVDEINMAMTGDMIIRIAQGATVQRGDLLMSAGNGTAMPQGDDIVRSKTVAKVTSNHVTCTYADGSYCVPCVLMAC
jgi:hypothetical protein